MKTKLMGALAVFALAGVTAYAQSMPLEANVPFEFVVGDRTVQAGEYTLTHMSPHPGVIMLSSETSNVRFFIMTVPDDPTKPPANPELVFKRYGDKYYLSQIWTGENGLKLRMSKKEVETARNTAPVEVALLLEPPTK
jgi:hypothetical protein